MNDGVHDTCYDLTANPQEPLPEKDFLFPPPSKLLIPVASGNTFHCRVLVNIMAWSLLWGRL